MTDDDARAEAYRWRREKLLAWRQLRREIRAGTFINEWLTQTMAVRDELLRADLANPLLNRDAEANGFRSARAWLEAAKDSTQVLERFLHEDAFRTLWSILKEHDKRSMFNFAYSPANGAVPARLLRAVSTWHQAPKFTAAERNRQDEKIAEACEVLEVLLSQVTPSHDLDNQYAYFRFDDDDHARAIFRAFGGDAEAQELEKRKWPPLSRALGMRLQMVGIEPLWAVRNIHALATAGPKRYDVLPRKVRAKAAKRTFYIAEVYRAITSTCMDNLDGLGISYQLIADVAALMADMDCSSDDVRKALESLEQPED